MIRDLFQYYLRQPDGLPGNLAEEILRRYPGEKILAYALCDLDKTQRFIEQWIILAGKQLLIATPGQNKDVWELQAFALLEIEKFEVFDGLSSSSLHLVGTAEKLLASLRFSRRQSRAVSNVQFVAEQKRKQLKEGAALNTLAEDINPNEEYKDAMLKAIEDAKAMLSMPKLGVMMRLLSYLRPTRA